MSHLEKPPRLRASGFGAAAGLLLLWTPLSALAQSGGVYNLGWNVLNGWGGSASGGVITMVVCAAQPSAGSAAGGVYTLLGGFLQPSISGASEVSDLAGLTGSLGLDRAAPNPTSGACTIFYDLPSVNRLALAVYDAGGRLVRSFNMPPSSPGRHALVWDGLDQSGVRAASGLYFVRLSTDLGEKIEKLVVLR